MDSIKELSAKLTLKSALLQKVQHEHTDALRLYRKAKMEASVGKYYKDSHDCTFIHVKRFTEAPDRNNSNHLTCDYFHKNNECATHVSFSVDSPRYSTIEEDRLEEITKEEYEKAFSNLILHLILKFKD